MTRLFKAGQSPDTFGSAFGLRAGEQQLVCSRHAGARRSLIPRGGSPPGRRSSHAWSVCSRKRILSCRAWCRTSRQLKEALFQLGIRHPLNSWARCTLLSSALTIAGRLNTVPGTKSMYFTGRTCRSPTDVRSLANVVWIATPAVAVAGQLWPREVPDNPRALPFVKDQYTQRRRP